MLGTRLSGLAQMQRRTTHMQVAGRNSAGRIVDPKAEGAGAVDLRSLGLDLFVPVSIQRM
jgi:hypothetical protein